MRRPPSAALLVEERSVSTRTNALNSLAVLDEHFRGAGSSSGAAKSTGTTRVSEILVVTSRFHSLRALRVFQRAVAERYGSSPPAVTAAPAGAGSWQQERDDMLAQRAPSMPAALARARERDTAQAGTCAAADSEGSGALVRERLRLDANAWYDFGREVAAPL